MKDGNRTPDGAGERQAPCVGRRVPKRGLAIEHCDQWHEMGFRIDYREKVKRYGFPRQLEDELLTLFEQNVDRILSRSRRTLKKLSTKTQEWRLTYICAMFHDLRSSGGFQIQSPWSLRHKHISWLVQSSVERGQAMGTIENKLTYLRALAEWMGKPNLVLPLEGYVDRKAAGLERHYVAQEDRAWSAKGIDIAAVIAKIEAEEPVAGVQLRLMWRFGLRVEEALKLKPAVALRDGVLRVDEGTKGGRKRPVPITHPAEQYAVLEAAARFANSRTGSTIPDAHSYDSWCGRLYSLLAKHGVARAGELGVTAHGLRHEYMQGLYTHITGAPAPIKADASRIDPAIHREGQRRVAEAAGHSRATKANAYLSTYSTQQSLRKPAVTPTEASAALAANSGNKTKAALALSISRRALYRLLERSDAGDRS